MSGPARLHPDDLAALADLVAERVASRLLSAPEAAGPGVVPAAALASPERLPAQPAALLTAAEVAARFGVSAEWVRENSARLGVIRLGDGPRPRLRFDAETVADALNARGSRGGSDDRESPAPPRVRGPQEREKSGRGAGLLPVFTLNSPEFEKTAGPRRANARPPATRIEPSPRPEPTPRKGSDSGAAGRAPRATTERSQ